jgi:hypothetical protein
LNGIDASLQKLFSNPRFERFFFGFVREGLMVLKILACFRKKANIPDEKLLIGAPCFSGTTYGACPNRPIFRSIHPIFY